MAELRCPAAGEGCACTGECMPDWTRPEVHPDAVTTYVCLEPRATWYEGEHVVFWSQHIEPCWKCDGRGYTT